MIGQQGAANISHLLHFVVPSTQTCQTMQTY
jgi:hypothetical protein